MLPNIWGPSLWVYLHLISINYPDNPSNKDISNHRQLLKYLGLTLPCDICKNHYFKYMTQERVKNGLLSKKNFIELIWSLHNEVNKNTDKPKMDFNKFLEEYDKIIKLGKDDHFNIFKFRENKSKSKFILVSLFIIMIIIVILNFYYIFIPK